MYVCVGLYVKLMHNVLYNYYVSHHFLAACFAFHFKFFFVFGNKPGTKRLAFLRYVTLG